MNSQLIKTIFQTSFASLGRNKSRTGLSILGIVIGVSAVTLLITIGEGLQQLIEDQFSSYGVNNLYIAPGDVLGEGGFSGPDSFSSYAENPLQYEHISELTRLRPLVTAVSATAAQFSDVSYRDNQETVMVTGVDPPYGRITNTATEKGAFFTEANDTKQDRVAVLGSAIAVDLFGQIDPIGKQIILENSQFTVIGVAEEKNVGFGSQSVDNYIYIPINTWFDVYDSRKMFEAIVQVQSKEDIPAAKEAVIKSIAQYVDEDEFSVFEQTEVLGIIDTILGGLTAGLGGIAAISLLVGGIGIMNIMLVSVTERTREIGLRKAVGATPSMIRIQFIIEALVLTIFGGMIGIVIAEIAAVSIISQFIPAKLSESAISLAFGVSLVIGVVFGVYPAGKAAKLSPIEAIRYE